MSSEFMDMEFAPNLETLLSVYGHLEKPQAEKKSSSSSASLDDSTKSIRDSKKSGVKRKSNGKQEQEDSNAPDSNKKAKVSSKKKKKGMDNMDDDDIGMVSEEKSRFRWTDELHQYFLACVFELGLEIASPKKVFNKMMANSTFARTILDPIMYEKLESKDPIQFGAHHVKSHLQRFRSNVVNPKAIFVKQLAELMVEAKAKHAQQKEHNGKASTKVLNPEYHAYPFSPDRPFPDGMVAASQMEWEAKEDGNNLTKDDSTVATSSASSNTSVAPHIPFPSTSSSINNVMEQMKIQVQMRERIESQSFRQIVGNRSDLNKFGENGQLNFSSLDDEDNLFDWLVSPDLFPGKEKDERDNNN